MKKIILIIDTLSIVITTILLFYYNNPENHGYGLAALESVGKFVLCLFFLGIEIIILIVVAILWLYKRFKK